MRLLWRLAVLLIVLGTVAGIACGEREAAEEPAAMIEAGALRDESPHRSDFVETSDGVRLHYLDWGGDGPAVVLLAGLGLSGHIYDEFAPLLTARFRVVALTRRGFGESDQPQDGYGSARLANDVLALLEALGIERASLVGHSIAVHEVYRFAELYPDRIDRVVLLDTRCLGCEESPVPPRSQWPPQPLPPQATVADNASLEAARAYQQRIFGFQFPTGEYLATVYTDSTGAVKGSVTPNAIFEAMRPLQAEEYARLDVPVLALLSVPRMPRDMFGWYGELSTEDKVIADQAFEFTLALEEARLQEWKRGADEVKVVELMSANHFAFLWDAQRVAAEIESFMAGDSN